MFSAPRIAITGTGAVTAAGWDVASLLAAMERGDPLPVTEMPAPGGPPVPGLPVRRVPKPTDRPAFLAHPRLRRASPVAQFAAAAALEAMGGFPTAAGRNPAAGVSGTLAFTTPAGSPAPERAGLVFTLLNGCVNYTGRFYGEALRDPATASPILFPETVFNAPASHTAALLGFGGPAFTLIGDSAQFFSGVELAVQWLLDDWVDVCLVVGAEEADPLTAQAIRLLAPGTILSEGAAALKLERWSDLRSTAPPLPSFSSAGSSVPAPPCASGNPVLIEEIPGPVPIRGLTGRAARTLAAAALRRQLDHLPADRTFLADDLSGCSRSDAPTLGNWRDWTGPRLSPRRLLGDAPGASAAVQCVLAAQAVRSGLHSCAVAAATGADQQAGALVLAAGLT